MTKVTAYNVGGRIFGSFEEAAREEGRLEVLKIIQEKNPFKTPMTPQLLASFIIDNPQLAEKVVQVSRRVQAAKNRAKKAVVAE